MKGSGWELLDSNWWRYITSFLYHNIIFLFPFLSLPLLVPLCCHFLAVEDKQKKISKRFLKCSTILRLGQISFGHLWLGWKTFTLQKQKALRGWTYWSPFNSCWMARNRQLDISSFFGSSDCTHHAKLIISFPHLFGMCICRAMHVYISICTSKENEVNSYWSFFKSNNSKCSRPFPNE